MKIAFFSDTHMLHSKIKIPSCDVLIHCGDFTSLGNLEEVEDFCSFLSSIKCENKIVIAGNHDFCLEKAETKKEAEEIFKSVGVHYLNDSGIEINGLNFWGSPVQPAFANFAFNRKRGQEIKKHWDLIPPGTDILVTHGPPFGVLDTTRSGESVGCKELMKKVKEVSPRVHAFGHIHEGYGELSKDQTHFINASSVNSFYLPENNPIVIDLK